MILEGGRKINPMNKLIRGQAVLEYTILFAVVTAALVASLMFVNVHKALENQFNKGVAIITGQQ